MEIDWARVDSGFRVQQTRLRPNPIEVLLGELKSFREHRREPLLAFQQGVGFKKSLLRRQNSEFEKFQQPCAQANRVEEFDPLTLITKMNRATCFHSS